MNNKHINTIHDDAYKLAASFYLASSHDEWSGDRIRKAILAGIDGNDEQAINDQQKLEVWEPIERHIELTCHPMSDAYEELDDLIEILSKAFVQFAEQNNTSHTRRVVIEHKVKQIGNSANKFPSRVIPAEAFGNDFDKYEGLTLRHEEGQRDGVWVSFSQTFLYTKKPDEQLLSEFH